MIASLFSSQESSSPEVALSFAQTQAWLQNALDALRCGADIPQAAAMLLKANDHLDTIARVTGQTCIQTPTSDSPLRFGVKTDRGYKYQKDPNEDIFFATCGLLPPPINVPFGLFVVADGMGGHANGQIASRLAIQQTVDFVLPRLLCGDIRQGGTLLLDGIQQAHQTIRQQNQQAMGQPADSAMGSLATALLIVDRTAYIANVGDSRTYLYRPMQGLRQITRDHSVVARLVEDGVITREDVYTHPKRNQVYRCLGEVSKSDIQVDLFTEHHLQSGDKFLLCSDGLWEMVRDPAIAQLMQQPVEFPAHTSHALYEAAIAGGGADNIAAIVVECGVPFSKLETIHS